jgi:hypothetical protein
VRQSLCKRLKLRADVALWENKDQEASRAMERALPVSSDAPEQRYVTARYLARCAGVADSPQAAGSPEERRQRQTRYAQRVVQLLGDLVPLKQIRSDPDFAPLCKYPEFQKLLQKWGIAPGKST